MPTASVAAGASSAWQQPQQPAVPDGFVSSVRYRRVLTAHFRHACQIAATFSCFTRQIPQRERERMEKAFTQVKTKRIVSLANYANVSSCSFMSFPAAQKKLWATTTAEQLPHGAMQCHLVANFGNFFVHSEFVSLA